ncbi:hypothetical protein [Bradyrhizobium sp. USDA 4508]
MTREHRRAKWQAAHLTAQLRAAGRETPRVTISHDPQCGIRTHRLCSCDPLIVAFTVDGESYVLDDRGQLHRLQRE